MYVNALGAVFGARRVRNAYNYLTKALRKAYAVFLLFFEIFLNTYKILLNSLLISVSISLLVFLFSILVYSFPEEPASPILRRASFFHARRTRHAGRPQLRHRIIDNLNSLSLFLSFSCTYFAYRGQFPYARKPSSRLIGSMT
jgi:hypothetical protein